MYNLLVLHYPHAIAHDRYHIFWSHGIHYAGNAANCVNSKCINLKRSLNGVIVKRAEYVASQDCNRKELSLHGVTMVLCNAWSSHYFISAQDHNLGCSDNTRDQSILSQAMKSWKVELFITLPSS